MTGPPRPPSPKPQSSSTPWGDQDCSFEDSPAAAATTPAKPQSSSTPSVDQDCSFVDRTGAAAAAAGGSC